MKEVDTTELKSAIASLKLNYFKGCAIKCPECNRKGYFGSVILYETESSNEYILCGWCGKITKKQFEEEK